MFNSKPFLLRIALRKYKCNLEDSSLYNEAVKAAINVKSTLKAVLHKSMLCVKYARACSCLMSYLSLH